MTTKTVTLDDVQMELVKTAIEDTLERWRKQAERGRTSLSPLVTYEARATEEYVERLGTVLKDLQALPESDGTWEFTVDARKA